MCFEVWDELLRFLEAKKKQVLLRQIAAWFFGVLLSQFSLLDLLKSISFTVDRRKYR